MSSRKVLSILCIGAGIAAGAWAQESQGQPLSLKQCIDLALSQNPLVLSSLEKYKAAQARVSQALALPQPSLSLDYDLQPRLFDFRGSEESYLGFSQTVEFPGKRSLRGKIAGREADEILSEIDILKLDLGFQVKQAFFCLLLAQEKLKYAQQDLELSLDFVKKAEAKQASGAIAEVEVLRARVEAAKTANVVKVVQNEKRLAGAELNFLLARKKYDPLEIRGDMERPFAPLNLEELERRALASRPEIQSIRLAMEKEGLKKSQAYLSYLPDFDVGIFRHRISGEQKTWDFTISFPVPIFFWQPKKGLVAEAVANTEALNSDADHLRNSIVLEVEEAYINALSASDQIKLYEGQVLAQAEEVYNIFLFKFQEGEIGGIELIDARRSLNEARKDYTDALYNYRLTIASLEKAIGQPLGGDQHDQNQ